MKPKAFFKATFGTILKQLPKVIFPSTKAFPLMSITSGFVSEKGKNHFTAPERKLIYFLVPSTPAQSIVKFVTLGKKRELLNELIRPPREKLIWKKM